ncbi:putative oxidoreductase, 2OG-Fe(II) oxygenase family [Aspergillus saccharolyticus JOP 1030-1]|uniref:Putative 2OG-Fe(II) oxygenase family oxidoreductase n=1 Tax=Aspergillus saccharolyticus JOP 1030-1 TaxID=1450539 RepID=A0A318ZM44_9EURO|nr:putative 2OG-Fe(II) oxygenase family oxidoreductase [Aspergillus saccharolyticus JOP 1030-1]PYH47534.1 putative 2OG-Fe(II) oxygenase family oxidoreductase [Aspergillus saccharolyticus JOP 1030-1]
MAIQAPIVNHPPQDDVSSKPLHTYVHPPETTQPLDYADLVTLDLSRFDTPEGKAQLVEQLKQAAHDVGFFYITNFGLTQDQIDRQYAIGAEFYALPFEERLKYRAPLEEGNYNGYRPLGSVELAPGQPDKVEMYNLFKFIPQTQRSQPAVIRRHWDEIEQVHRHIHENVAHKILRLLALVLELPDEEALIRGHRYEANCDSALRYMMSRARSAEENERCNHIYTRGHTDFGTLTFVFQQPVAALQVKRSKEAEWQWLRIPEGYAAVNIADIVEFLSNGYLKSGVHRVVSPPMDQVGLDRLGLLYFVRPSDEMNLGAIDSPLLRRLGYYSQQKQNEEVAIPATEWVRARVKKNWVKTESKEVLSLGRFQTQVLYD